MSIPDQIQTAAEYLTAALELLDQIGANVTAAQVDSAIECLKGEIGLIDWQGTSAEELEQIEALIQGWDKEKYGPSTKLIKK